MRSGRWRTAPASSCLARIPSVVVTDDLKRYERLKLFILNLGHTYLAEGWAARGGDEKVLTRQLLADPAIRADLEDLYEREVQPCSTRSASARRRGNIARA